MSSGSPPRVDLIDDAVAALEAELGGPQRYFEINATPQLVNLFVELNDGALVQPWVYLDGELSSTDAAARYRAQLCRRLRWTSTPTRC